jgi:F0F1-type ATP synthase membrane subunit b/b'
MPLRRLFSLSIFSLLPFALLAAEAEAGHGGDSTLTWKWINFAILFAGLAWLVYRQGGAFFRGRSQEILEGLSAAARRSEEAAARAAALDRKMEALPAEIARLREDAAAEMQAETERFRVETAQLVAKVEHHSSQDVAAAAKAATQQLRQTAAELALSLARQKVETRMNAETQGRLVDHFTSGLDSAARN